MGSLSARTPEAVKEKVLGELGIIEATAQIVEERLPVRRELGVLAAHRLSMVRHG
jgi:hypothetical protein